MKQQSLSSEYLGTRAFIQGGLKKNRLKNGKELLSYQFDPLYDFVCRSKARKRLGVEGDELKELEDQSNKQLTNEEGKEGETKIGKISELYKIQHSPTDWEGFQDYTP